MKKLILALCLLVGISFTSKAQFYSVSGNALALGTGTLHLESSMTLDRTWSLHGGVSFNPWKINSFRIQHLMLRPEVRYWFRESYRGMYVGGNAVYAIYHIGVPKFMEKKYEGFAFGGGVDLGYAWPIAPKWNIEVGIGASLLYSQYYWGKCKECSMRSEEDSKVLFVPTKLGVSIVYLF